MTQLLLFDLKKKRSLAVLIGQCLQFWGIKGDYSAFGEALYLRILKEKNIFIQIHFLLVR